MSAMNVVSATEGLINGLAASIVAGGRRPVQTGDSPRTIHAVRELIWQLEAERATCTALEEENAKLRHQLEEMAALVMRLRDHVAGN